MSLFSLFPPGVLTLLRQPWWERVGCFLFVQYHTAYLLFFLVRGSGMGHGWVYVCFFCWSLIPPSTGLTGGFSFFGLLRVCTYCGFVAPLVFLRRLLGSVGWHPSLSCIHFTRLLFGGIWGVGRGRVWGFSSQREGWDVPWAGVFSGSRGCGLVGIEYESIMRLWFIMKKDSDSRSSMHGCDGARGFFHR